MTQDIPLWLFIVGVIFNAGVTWATVQSLKSDVKELREKLERRNYIRH